MVREMARPGAMTSRFMVEWAGRTFLRRMMATPPAPAEEPRSKRWSGSRQGARPRPFARNARNNILPSTGELERVLICAKQKDATEEPNQFPSSRAIALSALRGARDKRLYTGALAL